MIAIYSNNYSTDYYVQQLEFLSAYQVYHNFGLYISATADKKIAFINHLNSYEPPESEQQRLEQVIDGRKFFQEVEQASQVSDLVFAFDTEMHPYHLTQFQKYKHQHIYWVIPGQINELAVANRVNVIVWNTHFDMQTYQYRSMQHKLDQIINHRPKTKYFDALLGQSKPHRDFVYNAVVHNQLQEKFLITYMNYHSENFDSDFAWEPDIEQFPATATRPTDTVLYQNQWVKLCNIVPVSVYNQTAYSVVAETGYSNQYSFFTEKTAKPMMARRLFVMFSGRGFLQNLREQGFRTFDDVVDESYDSIYNDHDRWSAAFEQVKKLCSMDQDRVFEQIADTVEHNYNLLMNTNWNQRMLDQLQEKINIL
jgi:hypothetical protein